jgi:hypothetical protein
VSGLESIVTSVWFQLVLGAFLGAAFSIAATIFIEVMRQPKLKLIILDPVDKEYPADSNRPVQSARFLYLDLMNKPLPKWLSWIQRTAAVQCYGDISFYNLDGQNVFGRSMRIRWSNTREPVLPVHTFQIDGERVYLIDYRTDVIDRVDVYPGDSQRLDVVARFGDDISCYGWSNENYSRGWRHPDWELPPERYIVKVTVISSGQTSKEVFRIVNNNIPRNAFRLEPAMKGDLEKLRD